MADVHDELVQRQTGELPQEPIRIGSYKLPNLATVPEHEPEANEEPSYDPTRFNPFDAFRYENYAPEAAAQGWGSSRYDRGEFIPDQDLEDRRAKNQSETWKIANGAIKGVVTAGTTYANTVAGTIAGVLTGAGEMIREAATKGEDVNMMKVADAGVNNFVTQAMIHIQELSERWFPNYRTAEERTDEYQNEWYKHIATGNFVGDSFLKNFGFTAGAIMSGRTFSRAVGKKMAKKYTGNLMKGVAAAAEGNPEAMAILEGTAKQYGQFVRVANPVALDKNILQMGKAMNEMSAKLQLFGSVYSAMGEGLVEGNMARDELMKDFDVEIENAFAAKSANLKEEVLAENSDYGTKQTIIDAYGNARNEIILYPEGEKRLAEKRAELAEEYSKVRAYANAEADRVASTTFLLNLPILTLSNTVQFGKLYSGGFKTAKKSLMKNITGGVKYDKLGRAVADYASKANPVVSGVTNALKIGGSEAMEEMLQGYVSSGSKGVADARISSYINDGYNEDIMRDFGAWLRGFNREGWEFLSDTKNWQEGFLGAITGLMGIPGRGYFKGERGGVFGSIAEAKDEADRSRRVAQGLNDAINSKDFSKIMMGYTRDRLYDKQLDESLEKNDEYAWHSAEDKKLINLVMMASDAGRLDELRDIAEHYKNMSPEQARQIELLDVLSDDENQVELENNPEEAVTRVNEQATDILDVIDTYNNIYNALVSLMPANTSEDQMEELIFTAAQIKRFDKRFLEMFGEVMDSLENTFRKISEEDKTPIENVRAAYARMFAGSILPSAFDAVFGREIKSSLDRLVEETKGTENEQKVKDMIKLSEDRKKFYDKFRTLREMKSETFDEKKDTPEKIQERKAKEEVKQEIDSFNSASDVRAAYFKINKDTTKKVKEERRIFVERMRSIRGENPNADEFVKLYDATEDFVNSVKKLAAPTPDNSNPIETENVYNPLYEYILDHLFENVESMDDLEQLGIEAFPSFADLKRQILLNNQWVSISDAQLQNYLAKVQKYLRAAMDKYRKDHKLSEVVRNHSEFTETKPGEVSQDKVDELDELINGNKVTAKTEGNQQQPPTPPAQSAPPAPAPENAVSTNPEFDDEETRITEEESDVRSTEKKPSSETVKKSTVAEVQKETDKEKRGANKTNGKNNFYRTSIPEYALDDMKKAREAAAQRNWALLSGMKLRTLPEVDPNFEATYNALVNKDAFNNMAKLDKGDKIKFVIMPEDNPPGDGSFDNSFPKYNGKEQVLMAVEKDGKLMILNILGYDTKNEKYYGLENLHAEIDKEYAKFKAEYDAMTPEQRKGKYFTFSKESEVWSIPQGVLQYDYSGKEEGIAGIDGFDRDAPIVIVNRNGNVVDVLTGEIVTSVSGLNRFGAGSMFYLAKTPGGYRLPIFLYKKQFNASTMGDNNKIFNLIRERLTKIANISKEAAEQVAPPMNDSDAEKVRFDRDIAGKRKELARQVRELSNILDLHRVVFSLGVESASGKVSLKITPDYYTADEQKAQRENGEVVKAQKPFYFRLGEDNVSNISPENVISYIAGLNRSINISTQKTGRQLLKDMIDSGVITSNANTMRNVGTDFYIYPWEPSRGEFLPRSTQKDAVKERVEFEDEETAAARAAAEAAAKTAKEEKSASAPEEAPAPSDEAPAQPPVPVDSVPEKKTEEKTDEDDDDEEPDEQKKGFYQIVGARRTPVSPETRDAVARARNGRWVKIREAENVLIAELRKTKGITNMRMRDSKLKEKLASIGVSKPVIDFIIEGIRREPSLRNMSPYDAFNQLYRLMTYDLMEEYDKGLKSRIDEGLENYLISFMSYYGVDVKYDDLHEVFGRDGIAGAYDVLEKTIWLSNNPDERNGLTMTEEFAHAFIELMGSSVNFGSDSEDFKYLYNTVVNTELYEQVYEKYKSIYKDENGNPDEYLIRKEAIGQALAAAIKHNWDERKLGKTEKDAGFWNQLKEWFNRILDLFRGSNISFEKVIDDIANEVLDGDTSRLVKVDDAGYNILDFEETIKHQNELDGGKAVSFMQYFSSLGNIISGSLAYRRQGTVYRGRMDSLHDIDMVVPKKVHNADIKELLGRFNGNYRRNPDFVDAVLSLPYFDKIRQDYPKIRFGSAYVTGDYVTVNAIYSEDESLSERFMSMTGSYADRLNQFTEEERRQMYLFDFFLHDNNNVESELDPKYGLNFPNFKHPFREKLKMGRAKDIYDYQMWRRFDSFSKSAPNPTDVLFQVTDVDYQQKMIDENQERVENMIDSSVRDNPADKSNIARALITIASQGPDSVSRVFLAIDNWRDTNVTLRQNVSDFKDVLNSLLTYDENTELVSALREIYGSEPESIDMSQLMHDYVEWTINHTVPGEGNAQSVLLSAFNKIAVFERNKNTIKDTLGPVSDSLGVKTGEYKKGREIGSIPNYRLYSALPSYAKELLSESKWSEESYNKASPLLQEKALRCAGVL